MTSQQRQLLDAFRASPGRKLTTSQLAGLPIVRYSARLLELKALGYAFTKVYVGKGQYEYRLAFDVERDGTPSRGRPDGEGVPSMASGAVSLSVDPDGVERGATPASVPLLAQTTASHAPFPQGCGEGDGASLSVVRPLNPYEWDLLGEAA